MPIYTVKVVFDSDDDDAVDNIQQDIVLMISSAASTVHVISASVSPEDGPLVDLIDLAEAHRNTEAQTQTVDQETQADEPSQEAPAESGLPTGKEF